MIIFITFICGCRVCRDQRTTCKSHFCPATTPMLGTDLRSAGLEASPSPAEVLHWPREALKDFLLTINVFLLCPHLSSPSNKH